MQFSNKIFTDHTVHTVFVKFVKIVTNKTFCMVLNSAQKRYKASHRGSRMFVKPISLQTEFVAKWSHEDIVFDEAIHIVPLTRFRTN